MPELVTKIPDLRKKVAASRAAGNKIGLVPTMGALHEGHLSLFRQARRDCGYVVVSIFVNPTQFGQGEDIDRYPRNLEKDIKLCENAGADLVFAPEAGEIYPEGFGTYVEPDSSFAGTLCGASRPGHFRGVCTVVLKLFNEVKPDAAYFGQKDYQQSAVIRKMAADLDLGLEIVVCPTVREEDGLAMSSRNAYLSPTERTQAICLHNALMAAKQAVENDKITDAALVKKRMTDIIEQAPAARIDYIEIVHPDTLAGIEEIRGKAVVVLAVYVGSTRLIDNMVLNAP